jgi:hypothetical protein
MAGRSRTLDGSVSIFALTTEEPFSLVLVARCTVSIRCDGNWYLDWAGLPEKEWIRGPLSKACIGPGRLGRSVGVSKVGSARESEQVRILRRFLKGDEFGSGRGQTLRFEQKVTEVLIAPAAS